MTALGEPLGKSPRAEWLYDRLRRMEQFRDRAAERLHKRNTPEQRRQGWGTQTTGRPKWAREKERASR